MIVRRIVTYGENIIFLLTEEAVFNIMNGLE